MDKEKREEREEERGGRVRDQCAQMHLRFSHEKKNEREKRKKRRESVPAVYLPKILASTNAEMSHAAHTANTVWLEKAST